MYIKDLTPGRIISDDVRWLMILGKPRKLSTTMGRPYYTNIIQCLVVWRDTVYKEELVNGEIFDYWCVVDTTTGKIERDSWYIRV